MADTPDVTPDSEAPEENQTPAPEDQTEDLEDSPPEDDTETEGEDDLGDDTDDDDGEGGEQPPPPQRQPGRANERIRALQERTKRAEAERDEYIRRLNGNNVDPGRAAREYEENEKRRLEEARTNGTEGEYWYQRTQRETAARLQMRDNQNFEQADAREFRQLIREIPAYGRVREYVEDYIAKQRQMGNYAINREAVAKYRLGELAVERALNGGGKQSQRAQRRVERETVPARSTRSDQRAPSRRKPESEWTAEDYERNIGDRTIA